MDGCNAPTKCAEQDILKGAAQNVAWAVPGQGMALGVNVDCETNTFDSVF